MDALVPITGPEVIEAQPVQSIGLFGGGSPAETVAKAVEVADALAAVIKAKQLSSNIQGKEYVRCEGWTMLGSMLGVFPVCVWTKPLTFEGVTYGYEARVEARTLSGQLVGAAEAQCSRSEPQWSRSPKDKYGKPLTPRDDFALRSMSQTRATGKSLRLPLGFIVALAGYEATPAEEMVEEMKKVAVASPQAVPEASDGDLTPALEASIRKARLERAAEEMGGTVITRETRPKIEMAHNQDLGTKVSSAKMFDEEALEKVMLRDNMQEAADDALAALNGQNCEECNGELGAYVSKGGQPFIQCRFSRDMFLNYLDKGKTKQQASALTKGHFYSVIP